LPDLIIAGAGMAGLCAAARAHELGASPLVLEKGTRAGGSMLLSSGFVWRYRDLDRFHAECPTGDRDLQRLVWERLDDGLRWLESVGAPVLERDTGNPLTVGARFDVERLTAALAARVEPRLEEPLTEIPRETPVVLATGGFQADPVLVRRYVSEHAGELRLRANRWSTGDGLRLGLGAGARTSGGMDEFYGRNMPAPPARVGEDDYVRLQQLYASHATVENERGERYEPRTWSEIDVVQWTARQPRARAWYVVPDEALTARVRERTVGEMVEAARAAGGPVERWGNVTRVEVVPGITSTLGGLSVDASARAADGIYVCGGDAGGISTGGYSSGLAAALVLGRVAAEAALGASG
jgi:succinate dehydrogenase/fumarate reductase flavoprotein subunit